ncbi:MAG: RtcB family protein [Chloroflexota bacterium]|nr:RtcB family protein [Chloroflexota bacterium]
MNEHQRLNAAMQAANLDKPERNHAWEVMRQSGIDAAEAYIETRAKPAVVTPTLREQPLPYRTWGADQIEQGALAQMDNAARLPITLAGALMPDAHQGYGLPIGGVLATDNAVIPYAVGVDIACRMMLTVYSVDPAALDQPAESAHLLKALVANTRFGAGGAGIHAGQIEHPVLDADNWALLPLTRDLRKTAIVQIGTSGTGNHFVEWCSFNVTDPNNALKLARGAYLALLSHSGSRGVGYKIASHYSDLAMKLMPGLPDSVKHLAWLALDSEAGQEYWYAMELAGAFASANHHVIHARVAAEAGLTPIASVENHHNFAWREQVGINGIMREAIVHRKGATPAGKGVLGIIPGSMGDAGYVVAGKGSVPALESASHGAGRLMSRTKAKAGITLADQTAYLARHNVTLIGGGLDESPQAYKRIEGVIAAQADLVQIIGRVQPRIVRMADDAPPHRRKPLPTGIEDAESD